MARLRSPTGCPWDREQSHLTLRRHAIEEVYELIDAIEAGDDHEMAEELGDLLLQIVFHCQLARERGAFDFEEVCRLLVNKLIRRHPHVFGKTKVKGVDEVWANWEKIKHAEKHGTRHARAFRVRRHPETSARAAPRRKTGEESAQGGLVGFNVVGLRCRAAKTITDARQRVPTKRKRARPPWPENFLNSRHPPRPAAGRRRNCWATKSRGGNGEFRRKEAGLHKT